MPTSYVGNEGNTQAPSAAPGAGVAPTISTPNDGEALNAAAFLQPWKVSADFIAWIQKVGLPGARGMQYGDGSDGALNVTGTTALGQDPGASKQYTTLDIGAAGTFITDGWIIRVKDTLTIAAGGKIMPLSAASLAGANNSGAAGGAGGVGQVGGATYLFGTAGGAGGAAGGNGVQGGNGALFGGGAGGGGGSVVTGGTLGAGGNGTFETNIRRYMYGIPGFAQDGNSLNGVVGLRGGSGGGGGAGNAGSGGGGGGAGGGVLIVFARKVVLASATDLYSPGGVGGNGSAPTSGSGGGGGGGGGVVALIYGTKTGADLTSACVPGGAAGTGGNGDAVAGAAGRFIMMNMG